MHLRDLVPIVGHDVIAELYKLAYSIITRSLINVNSTTQHSGVSELLHNSVPIMNDLGVDYEWKTIHGTNTFFDMTKKLHNALQGEDDKISRGEFNTYLDVNQHYSKYAHLNKHDMVIVHDPHPLAQIAYTRKKQPWVWRCHIDISNPNQEAWNYISDYLLGYDMIVVTHESYIKRDVSIRSTVIPPAINPLSDKNRQLDKREVSQVLAEYGIPTNLPVISQTAKMDKWKDPHGALEVFRRVLGKKDCVMVFVYNISPDDPEGLDTYRMVKHAAQDLRDSGRVKFVLGNNPIVVNAIQRHSTVVLQKSIKEGFGLTVAESMWKGTPVVASNVGGIPLQVDDYVNGFLVDTLDYSGFADRVLELINNPSLRQEMSNNAKEKIRSDFLITRMIKDNLVLYNSLLT